MKAEPCSPRSPTQRQFRFRGWRTRRGVLISLALSALNLAAPSGIAEPAADAKLHDEAVIDALLNLAAPPPDWRDFLKHRKQVEKIRPKPDAPIEAVKGYWRSAPETEIPDAVTQTRLLEVCEVAPDEFAALRGRLALDSPDVQDRLKKVYDLVAAERTDKAAQIADLLRDELMHHGHYFREELIRRAFFPDDINEFEATRAKADLIRMDRNAAKEILLKNAVSTDLRRRAIALAALQQNFGGEVGAEGQSKWRDELMRIAADTKGSLPARRLALLQVTSERSASTAAWFIRLFHDSTLNVPEQYSSRSTPLGDVVAENPDYWIPKVAPLVSGKDSAVHSNAVNALIQYHIDRARADALRPLLPWLEDPNWAPNSKEILGRLRLIQSLDRVDLPEAVPGLLKVAKVATGWELRGAAEALAHYNSSEAIEPLKRGLKREQEDYHRWALTRAVLKLNGFSQKGLVEALRMYALEMSTPAGQKEIESGSNRPPTKGLDYRISVGQEIARTGLSDDAMAKAVLEEAVLLAASNPTAADLLRQFVAKWKTPSASKEIASRLQAGDITAEWVKKLIENRAAIAASLVQLRDLKGAALGVQAALTSEASLVTTVLAGQNRVAQRSLLAVARLARVEMPIDPVSKFLTSADKPLVRAAELYLEALDTATARNQLWEHFENQARILGYPDFTSSEWTGGFHGSELRAQEAILREDGPHEIYALLSEGTWGGHGQRILLVYEDHVILRGEDGNGRSRERKVPQSEFAALRDWLIGERVDELPPFDRGTFDGVQYEYLHLSRAGGRRVYMNNPPGANASPRVEINEQRPGPDPAIYGELTERLLALSEAQMVVNYPALETMAGYRLMHASEEGEITELGLRNGKLAASLQTNSGKTREWHFLNEVGLSKDFIEETVEPDSTLASYETDKVAAVTEGPLAGSRLKPDWGFQTRKAGLFLQKNQESKLVAAGVFGRPVVCPGGEWVVVAKTPDGKMWNVPNNIVRINLRTKAIMSVDIPPADTFDPLTWIAPHQRVLLHRAHDDTWQSGPDEPEFFLLDPATGNHEKVTGEFRPCFDASKHPLQPSTRPNEFWAVINEEKDHIISAILGRYDIDRFRFIEVRRFPAIHLQSANVWVDESARMVFVSVNGDLLRFSLPNDPRR